MARSGAGVYSLPAGSTIANGDTSDATDLNTPLADIAADLNVARPIVAGGTGATSAAGALVALGLTATAAELNTLDGITASLTELNYTDGVTSAIQTQLDAKAPLASPTLTGTPASPTAAVGTNTTQIATTAYVQANSGWTFIATADASAVATVDFTGFDAAKYDAYAVVLSNVIPATDGASLALRTSTNGGSAYDSGASDYLWVATGTSVGSAAVNVSSAGDTSLRIAGATGNAAGESGVTGMVYICGPHLTGKTMINGNVTLFNDSGVLVNLSIGGARVSLADVDAVRFLFSTGNIGSGTLTFYGLKNA